MSNFGKQVALLIKKKKHQEEEKERTNGVCRDEYKFPISLKVGTVVHAKGPSAFEVFQFGKSRKYLECRMPNGEQKNIKIEDLNMNELVKQFEQ